MLLALCEPGWEEPLGEELRARFGEPELLQPGVWQVSQPALLHDEALPWSAWARQMLPHAERLTAPSINRWADLAADYLITALADYNGPWSWSAGAVVPEVSAVSPRRIELIQAALDERLKRKQKRLLRTRINDPFDQQIAYSPRAQLLWGSETAGYWSYLSAEESHRMRRCLAVAPAGYYPPAVDKAAPARAFAKLVEAELQLGRAIQAGETCVDLGASPGSWTWWAVQRGATVVAWDRSPLRDDLMRHPRVRFERGDAFAFLPAAQVDWLLCDVAAFPERILELLNSWLPGGHCRQAVVTIKFRGVEDYRILPQFAALLSTTPYDWRLRRMSANKNEVTVLARLSQ